MITIRIKKKGMIKDNECGKIFVTHNEKVPFWHGGKCKVAISGGRNINLINPINLRTRLKKNYINNIYLAF
jgi:hypothetical protein